MHGWAQPEHYQVYALKFANTGFAMPISVWVDHGPQNDSVNIDFSIWLIKGDKDRNVLVDAADHKIILASDNIWVYYSLEHLQPASPGGTFDPAGYVRSMVRMKTLTGNPRYIIPGHDARVYAIFPKVADGVVRIE